MNAAGNRQEQGNMRLKFLRDKRKQLEEKKGSFSLPVFIIERSRAIEIVFVIAVLLSMLAAPFVNINYDLTRYSLKPDWI